MREDAELQLPAWSPRVSKAKIARLYASMGKGIVVCNDTLRRSNDSIRTRTKRPMPMALCRHGLLSIQINEPVSNIPPQ